MRAARAGAAGRGWFGLMLALLPAAAAACPYCAARSGEGRQAVYLLIAALCLLPLVVGGGALAVIRKLDCDPESNEERRP